MSLRLDRYLADKKLASSRVRAKAMIEDGLVFVDGGVVTEPDFMVKDSAVVELRGEEFPWVSRGALKLIAALDHFHIDPHGKAALDLGASTGGFTEVLLNRGAIMVYAVDVGHGQLHVKLEGDGRVVNMEGVDARELSVGNFRGPIPLVVGDLSFISLKTILPVIWKLLAVPGDVVLLVKPQFEVGKGNTKKGIVKDSIKTHGALQNIIKDAEEIGFIVDKPILSPIKGGSGNTEYLIHFKK